MILETLLISRYILIDTSFNVSSQVRPEIQIVDKYVTIAIYIIGFPGNIINFIVWMQRRMRHSSGCYLTALAGVDIIFLILQIIFDLQVVWLKPVLNYPVIWQVRLVLYNCNIHASNT